MSSYICFYANEGKNYISLIDYSRNSDIYQALKDYVPYEEGIELTQNIIKYGRDTLQQEIKAYETHFENQKKNEILIFGANNSLDDKMETLIKLHENDDEVLEELEALKYSDNFLALMNDFVENMSYNNTKIMVGIDWDPYYKEEKENEND